jgi:glycosyltransferase involved in cell wall biosynthesis
MNKSIFIITSTFPFCKSSEESFILNEINHLNKLFHTVTIIPSRKSSDKSDLSDFFELDDKFALKKRSLKTHIAIIMYAVSFGYFWLEIYKNRKNFLNFNLLSQIIIKAGENHRSFRFFKKKIKDKIIDPRNSVFYTYWLGSSTFGIGLLKKHYPDIVLVSRAHSIDLYGFRHKSKYIPFQKESCIYANRIYCISMHGIKYLLSKYRAIEDFSDKITLARLGVIVPDTPSPDKSDSVFRFVSCSRVVEIKQVDIIQRGIQLLCGNFKSIQVEWHHFGDGPELEKINKSINLDPPNMYSYLHGYVKNESIKKEHYSKIPFDLFINASVFEGIPVSIMEAMSHSIPVVAPNVGGISELINSTNGILAEPPLNPEKLQDILKKLVENQNILQSIRQQCADIILENYNARINFDIFAKSIAEM